MIRARVLIKGRVQGVGYRYSTLQTAGKYGLTGWCRNNPDSSVEAVFEGERAVIEKMLDWCWQGPSIARVDSIEVSWEKASGEFPGFFISH